MEVVENQVRFSEENDMKDFIMAVACPKCKTLYGLEFSEGFGEDEIWRCKCGYSTTKSPTRNSSKKPSTQINNCSICGESVFGNAWLCKSCFKEHVPLITDPFAEVERRAKFNEYPDWLQMLINEEQARRRTDKVEAALFVDNDFDSDLEAVDIQDAVLYGKSTNKKSYAEYEKEYWDKAKKNPSKDPDLRALWVAFFS